MCRCCCENGPAEQCCCVLRVLIYHIHVQQLHNIIPILQAGHQVILVCILNSCNGGQATAANHTYGHCDCSRHDWALPHQDGTIAALFPTNLSFTGLLQLLDLLLLVPIGQLSCHCCCCCLQVRFFLLPHKVQSLEPFTTKNNDGRTCEVSSALVQSDIAVKNIEGNMCIQLLTYTRPSCCTDVHHLVLVGAHLSVPAASALSSSSSSNVPSS